MELFPQELESLHQQVLEILEERAGLGLKEIGHRNMVRIYVNFETLFSYCAVESKGARKLALILQVF